MAAGQGGGSNKEGANLLAFCYAAATEDEVLRPLMREGGEDKDGAATPLREQALRLRTPDGRTALHCAVQRRWLRLADALVGWGASPTEPGLGTSGNTPLHVAANTGEARMLKVLLASQHLSSTDVPNANGDSALMFACAGGHLGCASLLLAAGAAIGHTNSAGLGPLAIALGDGAASRPVLDLLLRHLEQCSGEEREAVLHAPSGQQVLHIAASAGQGDTVARLLRAGADPFRRNAAGRLPIEEAERAVPLRARSSNPTIVALREAMAERGEAAEAAAAALLRDDENPSQQPKRKIAALLQQRHPKAAALEIEPMNVLGLGIEQLSMSQLEALEEIHLGELSRVADARVQLASQQKLAAHLEAAKLAREFREVLENAAALPAIQEGAAGGKPRIVILGSGWGAMSAIKSLKKSVADRYEIVVVSPRNHFVYTPLLPSVSSGTCEERSIVEPVRKLVAGKAKFLEAECDDIDVEKKNIVARFPDGSGESFKLPYDLLVVTVGSVTNTFNTPGVQENCVFMKSIQDARKLRKQITDCFERAALPNMSEEEKIRLLSFVVVGGGPTGVEVAAEMHDLIHDNMKRLYPDLMKFSKIRLVASDDHMLSTYDRTISEFTLEQFRKMGIETYLHCRATGVSEKSVDVYNKQSDETFSVATGPLRLGDWREDEPAGGEAEEQVAQ
eukprot:jgi/Tetstr1/442517/TSEL_030615.t1